MKTKDVELTIRASVEDRADQTDPFMRYGPSATSVQMHGSGADMVNLLCVVIRGVAGFREIVIGALRMADSPGAPPIESRDTIDLSAPAPVEKKQPAGMGLRIINPEAPTLPEAFGLQQSFLKGITPLIDELLQEEIIRPQQWNVMFARLAAACSTTEELVWAAAIFSDHMALGWKKLSLP